MDMIKKALTALTAAGTLCACVTANGVSAASTMIKGDVDRDDRVSVCDIVILKNYILGRYGLNDEQLNAADMNCDGLVDNLDLSCLQEAVLESGKKLPVGTWIGDCGGAKRYLSFGNGAVTITTPDGSSVSYRLETVNDLLIFRTASGAEMSAFITWTGDRSFVLKWENGSAETYRYLYGEKLNSSELLSGRWVTSQGRTFEINGLSGKVTDKSGGTSRFEYAPDGGDIVFHFGNTENAAYGKKVRNDSMHFTVTWSDGTAERFTRQEIEERDGITYINGILIANKTYSLPAGYNPAGILPEPQAAFNTMQADAKKAGYSLSIASGYRSYAYQGQLYNNYVARDGQAAADTYSARAGHSEHQTGLAMDINYAGDWFTGTPEAKWLAANCVNYGFIIRYPLGKESITGYQYESWHIRYLGKELAKEVADSGLTLEEFLCIDSEYRS